MCSLGCLLTGDTNGFLTSRLTNELMVVVVVVVEDQEVSLELVVCRWVAA